MKYKIISIIVCFFVSSLFINIFTIDAVSKKSLTISEKKKEKIMECKKYSQKKTMEILKKCVAKCDRADYPSECRDKCGEVSNTYAAHYYTACLKKK